VVVVEPTGAETQVLARFGTTMLVVVLRERVELNPGDSIGLRPDLSTVHLFGEDGRRL
jgi:multiple sugar transport system ATP-binding protein